MHDLQDHFGEDEEEADGERDGGGGEDEQIWHSEICDGGLRKVHFMHDQEDIGDDDDDEIWG